MHDTDFTDMVRGQQNHKIVAETNGSNLSLRISSTVWPHQPLHVKQSTYSSFQPGAYIASKWTLG